MLAGKGNQECCKCKDATKSITHRHAEYIDGRPLYRYPLCPPCLVHYDIMVRVNKEREKKWYWRFYWKTMQKKRRLFSRVKTPYYRIRWCSYRLKVRWKRYLKGRDKDCKECEHIETKNCWFSIDDCIKLKRKGFESFCTILRKSIDEKRELTKVKDKELREVMTS